MSFTPAKPITSPQTDIHDNLEKNVLRHLQHTHQKPIAEHNRQAFTHAYRYWQHGKSPAILDSGCGTGESSRYLAKKFPDHLVIGVDQSEKRLSHKDNHYLADNCLLLRCECSDCWALAKQYEWSFALHTLFYPNPYPKPQQLQRRWHGHAAFNNLLNISKGIILRTNWSLYAQEFYKALKVAKNYDHWSYDSIINHYTSPEAITAFERKYQLSKHDLWQVLSLADNTANPL